MTDKEKLTELLRSAIKGTDRSWNTVIPDCLVEAVAENLLAHGVTVHEWISVKDRLPYAEYGESDDVLTVDEHGIVDVLYFDGGCWCYPTGEVRYKWSKITHWMPLPEPPKGE